MTPQTSGAELLDDLLAVLNTYVVLPDRHAAAAVTLWIAATHALPAFECAPRLVASSPDKRCGKTRLLDIITGTSHRPLATVNATVAAIFRSIGDAHPPTLVIDEADTLFGSKRVAENNEDLRALLNAGHQRGRPALRCVGPNQIPTEFNTFAMAALAGIGQMPDTITDRAVNITMRRRTTTEKVSQFRARRDGLILAALRDRLAVWADEHATELTKAQPDMPVEDRAADTWEPLVAVADVAGGHWPATARAACSALVSRAAEADEDQSLAVKLLADVRDIFDQRATMFLPSAELVNELRKIDDSPWNDFDLSPRKLAYRLKDFGIKPERVGHAAVRGYRLETLHDVFQRYIRQQPSAPVAPQVNPQNGADGSQGADTSIRQREIIRQHETPAQTALLTDATLADGYPPETGRTDTAAAPSPAEMPTKRPDTKPARARTRGKHRCPCGGLAPARTDTGLCDFCTTRERAAAVVSA